MVASFLCFEYFYPVVVRVMNEVQPHLLILITYASEATVILTYSIIIAVNPDRQMSLVLAEIVWLRMVSEPRQFKSERISRRRQVYYPELTFRMHNLADLLKP